MGWLGGAAQPGRGGLGGATCNGGLGGGLGGGFGGVARVGAATLGSRAWVFADRDLCVCVCYNKKIVLLRPTINSVIAPDS